MVPTLDFAWREERKEAKGKRDSVETLTYYLPKTGKKKKFNRKLADQTTSGWGKKIFLLFFFTFLKTKLKR